MERNSTALIIGGDCLYAIELCDALRANGWWVDGIGTASEFGKRKLSDIYHLWIMPFSGNVVTRLDLYSLVLSFNQQLKIDQTLEHMAQRDRVHMICTRVETIGREPKDYEWVRDTLYEKGLL